MMTIITTIAVFLAGFGVGYLHAWLSVEYDNVIKELDEEEANGPYHFR